MSITYNLLNKNFARINYPQNRFPEKHLQLRKNLNLILLTQIMLAIFTKKIFFLSFNSGFEIDLSARNQDRLGVYWPPISRDKSFKTFFLGLVWSVMRCPSTDNAWKLFTSIIPEIFPLELLIKQSSSKAYMGSCSN